MPTVQLPNSSTPQLPNSLSLSHTKLKLLQPELYAARSWTKFVREHGYRLAAPNESAEYWKEYVAEYLRTGDTCAAVVVSAAPLLVAAYGRELDGVALLGFSDKVAIKYELNVGAHLLASNTYLEWRFWLPEDLKPGPRASGKYRNFAPLIADFLSDDVALIDQYKAEITPAEWKRALTLGQQHLAEFGAKARDGRPLLCHLPAKK